MSLTKFKKPSLLDKQEKRDNIEDPRMEKLDEKKKSKKKK